MSGLAREALAAARARLDAEQRTQPQGGASQIGRDAIGSAFEARAQEFYSRALDSKPPKVAQLSGSMHAGGISSPNLVQRVLEGVDAPIRAAENLPVDVLQGRVSSPAEIAATIKRADLTLKYSLEIRNRLVDAYREVMRMGV